MTSAPNSASQSTPQQSSNPITSRALPLNAGHMPGANHVASVLKGTTGGSPLEYIRNNLQTKQPEPVPNTAVPEKAPASQAVQQTAQEGLSASGTHISPSATTPAPSVEPPKAPEAKAADGTPDAKALADSILKNANGNQEQPPLPQDDLDLDAVKGSPLDNLKRMRKQYVETREVLKTKEQELEATRTKLAKYESGEVLPDALKAQASRIQELEQYEKVYKLESSPEYQQRLAQPLEEKKAKLDNFAKAYNVPPEELHKLIDVDDLAESNAFLSERFDDLAGLQIRQIIDEAQGIKHQMQEARKEPDSILAKLVSENKAVEERRAAEANTRIASSVKNSWQNALGQVKQEGWATELIYRDNDTEHNAKFVDPIVNKAAEEHGKIILSLVKAGLKEIPDELSHVLARQCLLAHASATAIESRNYITRAYAELEANTKRANSYRRPSVGSSFNGGSGGNGHTPAPDSKPLTPESMAVKLRESVQKRA